MDSAFKLHSSALAIIFNLFDIDKYRVIGIERLAANRISGMYLYPLI